jgi:hypothetical protein
MDIEINNCLATSDSEISEEVFLNTIREVITRNLEILEEGGLPSILTLEEPFQIFGLRVVVFHLKVRADVDVEEWFSESPITVHINEDIEAFE